MDDAHLHLTETLGHLQHEDEENPGLDEQGHEAHREELTTQACSLVIAPSTGDIRAAAGPRHAQP